MSALEFTGVQGFSSDWGGVEPAWSVWQTWSPNCVRLPLNVGSWLGLTCNTVTGNPASSFSGTIVNCDPHGTYRQTVIDSVAKAQAVGCYVILDLHWSAPQLTLGGTTAYATPNGQPEFSNSSTDITFWSSIASTFGSQATPSTSSFGTIDNTKILFELFNEPYIDDYASGSTLYGLMLNGGTVATYHSAIGAWSVSPTGGVGIAGYQQMLNAIRATGATNICIINGPSFTQELQNYTQWMPTDTLSTPQLACGWHPYGAGSYPYSTGNVYPRIGNDTGGNAYTSFQWAQAVLNAGVPLIITEDGGTGNPTTLATPPEPHMAAMQLWADTAGASYVYWQWNNPQSGSNTANYATKGTVASPTPIPGEGTQCFNWQTDNRPYVRQWAQFYGSASSTSSNTWNATINNVQAGSTLYAVGMWPNYASPYDTMGVTDSSGANVYTILDRVDDTALKNFGIEGTQSMGHWYRSNVAAGNYVVNLSPTPITSEDWVGLFVVEIANAAASPIGGHSIAVESNVSPGTNAFTLNISTNQPECLVIGVVFDEVAFTTPTEPLPGTGVPASFPGSYMVPITPSGMWPVVASNKPSASAAYMITRVPNSTTNAPVTFSPQEPATGGQLPNYICCAAAFT